MDEDASIQIYLLRDDVQNHLRRRLQYVHTSNRTSLLFRSLVRIFEWLWAEAESCSHLHGDKRPHENPLNSEGTKSRLKWKTNTERQNRIRCGMIFKQLSPSISPGRVLYSSLSTNKYKKGPPPPSKISSQPANSENTAWTTQPRKLYPILPGTS